MATTNTQKLHFDTTEERDAVNAAYAMWYGMDMVTTVFWWAWGEDEDGHYIITDDWE